MTESDHKVSSGVTLYIVTDEYNRVIDPHTGVGNGTLLKVGLNSFTETNVLHVQTYLYLFDMLVHENSKYIWEFDLWKDKHTKILHPITKTITHVWGDIELKEPREITSKLLMDLKRDDFISYHTSNLGAVVWACRNNDIELLKDILEKSPLLTPAECSQYVIKYKRREMLDMLIENGLQPWDISTRVLDMCCYYKNREFLYYMMYKYASHIHDPILLYNIARLGYYDIIEIALRNDDYTYDELNKALENAASNGWAMTSRVLISRGADINITLKYPKVHKELYQKW